MSEVTTNPKGLIEVSLPGDTVGIRQLSLDDAQGYFALVDTNREHLSQFGDDTAAKYQTIEDVQGSIVNPEPNKFRFGIWDGDTLVGTNNLRVYDGGVAESGSWVATQFAGNHYAARARKPLLEFAFKQLGVETVVSKIAVGNEASRKSIEKSGYKFIGEQDDQWVFQLKKEDYVS